MRHPTTPDAGQVPQAHPTGERRAELERIRAAKWPAGETAEAQRRADEALAAWRNRPEWDVLASLDADAIRHIVESPDVYEGDE